MTFEIRRLITIVDEKRAEAGRASDPPLRKVAAIAVIENPCAGRYVEDLKFMIEGSVALGRALTEAGLAAMGSHAVQSYGKAAIVGTAGEQEHGNALLTTAFAEPIRASIGGGDAWISSMTKVAGEGASIDVPVNCKDEVYVRSHYDGMTLAIPGAPLPNEIAVILVLMNRGRLNARVGGMTLEEAQRRARKL